MSGPGDTIRVLHVDDEPGLGDVVGTFLEREADRIEVETATDASEGLAIVADHQIDCIVSDYDMPGQNGVEFLETVREEYADLPFILYTGKGSEEVASEAISAGVTDYLQKESGTDQYTLLANRVVNAVERYRAEREAEHTQTQLQAISENSTDAIVIVDTDSRIQFVNPAVESLVGYEPSELQGESLTTILPERFREEHLAALERYVQTGERTMDWSSLEFRGQHRDGAEIPLSVSFSEFEQDGEKRFIGILRDISERTRMEAQLREREQRFRQLAENIQEVVWMSDPDKEELIYVNPTYEEVWEQSAASLYDDPTSFLDRVHPDDRDRVRAALDGQRRGDYDEEYRIVHDDGEVRWIDDYAVPVENDDGEVYRIVGIASDITEEKEQKRQLETLIDNLPGIVYQSRNEPDWPMEVVRGECEEITGYSADALERGEVIWGEDILHPNEQERMWTAVQEALENDEPFEVTYRIQTKDGETKWMWERGRLIDAPSQDETVLEGFITDITEQKERERELTRIERRYQAVFDDPNILFGLLDTDGRVLDINQTAMEYVDATYNEVIELPAWEAPWFDHSKSLQAEVKDWIDRAAGGEYVGLEVDLPGLADGSVTVEGVIRPVTDDDGDVVSLLISGRDVTERKTRERALQRTKRRLDLALQEARAGLWEWGLDTDELYCSDELLEILEIPADEFDGEIDAFEDRLHPDDVDRTEVAIEEAIETGGQYQIEQRLEDDGEYVWLDVRGQVVTDGDITSMVGIGIDITDRKEQERQLQRQRDRLDQFASVVSHDLRNPLRVAHGRLELARAEGDTEHLTEVQSALDRMDRIIEDVLWLAREGQDIGSLESVTIGDAVEASWSLVADDTAQAELDVSDDLPTATVRADSDRLRQLLENLLRNSVEHGGDGVTVTAGRLSDGFYIEDDGPGIEPDDRDDIFDVGYSTSDEGTGFGLAIVEQVVQAHDWEIRVTDGTDGGVRFEIVGVEFAPE